MNNKTTLVVVSLVVLALILVAVWRFIIPSEVLAPTDEESNTQESTTQENNEPSGQFLQQAPEEDPLLEDVTEETADEEEADNEVTISMTDTGFSPSTITVPAGTRVTFINNGQALHWPASDNHPTHEVLPEFDANRGLSTGESYSFTFEEVGQWGFHDHLNAQFTGTVIVE